MTRTTFENVTISLTAPTAADAYTQLIALLTAAPGLAAQISICTDRYTAQPADTLDGRTVDGPTSDLYDASWTR